MLEITSVLGVLPFLKDAIDPSSSLRSQARPSSGTELDCVRATAPELAGDLKFRYITNQLVDNTHLAGDPKRKGCRSLLGIINLSMEIMEIINNKVG